MEILNIIAIILIIIFILVMLSGLLLVRLGQNRMHYLIELKIMISIMVVSFTDIVISMIILGHYNQLQIMNALINRVMKSNHEFGFPLFLNVNARINF